MEIRKKLSLLWLIKDCKILLISFISIWCKRGRWCQCCTYVSSLESARWDSWTIQQITVVLLRHEATFSLTSAVGSTTPVKILLYFMWKRNIILKAFFHPQAYNSFYNAQSIYGWNSKTKPPIWCLCLDLPNIEDSYWVIKFGMQ